LEARYETVSKDGAKRLCVDRGKALENESILAVDAAADDLDGDEDVEIALLLFV
jgi:hypothetical protein